MIKTFVCFPFSGLTSNVYLREHFNSFISVLFVLCACFLYNYMEKSKDIFPKLDAKIPENETIVEK